MDRILAALEKLVGMEEPCVPRILTKHGYGYEAAVVSEVILAYRDVKREQQPILAQIPQAEWDAIHSDYKGVWDTERTDWPNWGEVRDKYMGKRTWQRFGALEVEGISFEIV